MAKPAGGGPRKGISPVIVVVVIVVVLLVVVAVWLKFTAPSGAGRQQGGLRILRGKLQEPKGPATAAEKAAAEKVKAGLEKGAKEATGKQPTEPGPVEK
jgi:flagellar basal body-associated protein FliL